MEDGNVARGDGMAKERASDSSGQSEIELKELALEVEHPKITLQQAARDGRENIVQQWMNLLPADSIDDQDSEGFSALHYATRFNKFKIIQLLIASGADPELESRESKLTPLHFAASFKPSREDEGTDATSAGAEHDQAFRRHGAQHGLGAHQQSQLTSKNIIEFLITSCGVEVNCQDRHGVTPLHLACSVMNIAAVEALLQCTSIDPSIKDNNHNTPLHEACQSGNVFIVEKILQWMKVGECSLDLLSPNRDKRSPLHVAAKNGHSSIVKLILHHGFDRRAELVGAVDTDGSTPLHLACESRVEETVRTLLVSGADIKARKYDEVSALHSAAAHDAVSIAQILLEAGLDIQTIDAHHQSPLHYATRHNRVEMTNFLIERGADLEAVDAEFYTPLLTAAFYGQMEVYLVLLQKGASIDVMEKDGKNVVFLAAENNHMALLMKVLEHPLGTSLCDERDLVHNTPLHVAAAKGNHKVVDALLHATVLIKARNRFGQTATQIAAENGREKVLKKLIANCRDVVLDEDEKGYTPLHFACRSGHFAAAKVLMVEGEASIEAKNFKLWTPLTYAAKVGSEPLTEMLIKAGAEIDPKDRFKQTPLHLACRGGHTRVVTLLTSHGADVTKKDQNGFNALDAAIDEGHEEVAMAIVKGHKWAAAMRNVTQSRLGGETTPLRKLIRKMPAVAEEVFNRCTVSNTSKTVSPDSPEYRVIFNYEFIEDLRDKPSRTEALRTTIRRRRKVTVPGTQVASDSEAIGGKRHGYTTDWGPKGFKPENHPLTIMVESERTELLKHPLVTSLLNYKWRKYTRYVYFGNVAIYLLFIIFLTAFALVVHSPLEIPCQMALYNSSRNGFAVDCELSAHRSRFLYTSATIIILFAVLRLIIESLQFFQYRLAYLFSWDNWLEIILFICSIIFVSVFRNGCLCPYSWQWQIGVVAVFLAWIDLIIFLQKFPLTGIYILMFINIFYTFCRMIVLSILLVLAFGLAFYMCFYDPSMNNVSFSNPGLAILRTMTMTTGEFDYVPLFRQDGETNGIAFPPVSYILWIIFIILMPILLTNLLVGLAVDDIKGILEAAVLKRKALLVELALSVEQRFPRSVRRFFITGMLEVAPNRSLSLWEQFAYQVWGKERFDSAENIAGAVKFIPPVDSIEHQTRSLVSDMRSLKQTVSEIAERNNYMEKLIRKIAKRNGINVDNK